MQKYLPEENKQFYLDIFLMSFELEHFVISRNYMNQS